MILAFPVESDKGFNSHIHNNFGEAPGFFWVNTDTEEMGYFDNDVQDSGITAVRMLGDISVEAVVVSGIGCAIVNRLRGIGAVAYSSRAGTVAEAKADYESGALRPVYAGECDGSCR